MYNSHNLQDRERERDERERERETRERERRERESERERENLRPTVLYSELENTARGRALVWFRVWFRVYTRIYIWRRLGFRLEYTAR